MRYHDPAKQAAYQRYLVERDNQILALYFDGMKRAEIAERFKLTMGRISGIVNREANADYRLVDKTFINVNET
jgi:DNA-directed RNA polymerase specialized sigma subunit